MAAEVPNAAAEADETAWYEDLARVFTWGGYIDDRSWGTQYGEVLGEALEAGAGEVGDVVDAVRDKSPTTDAALDVLEDLPDMAKLGLGVFVLYTVTRLVRG